MDGPPDLSGARGEALFLGLVALMTLTIVSLDIFTILHDRALAGRSIPAWEPTVWEASSGLCIILLTPALTWLARRFPLRAPPRLAWLGVHLAGAVAFSLVHVLGMGLGRWAAYASVGDAYDPLSPLGDWPYELRKDVLIYTLLLVSYDVCRRLVQAPRPRPAAAEPIEVRDGARRLYVAVDDILWVEAAGNYVELHRLGGPVLHRAPLAEMERRLAASDFVRIHRSRLVSRAAIAAVETKPSGDFTLRLTCGQTLAGSRRFRTAALDRKPMPD
jgi:hypothetical protein